MVVGVEWLDGGGCGVIGWRFVRCTGARCASPEVGEVGTGAFRSWWSVSAAMVRNSLQHWVGGNEIRRV